MGILETLKKFGAGIELSVIDKTKKFFSTFVGLMIILSAFSIVAFFLNAVGKETANSNGYFYTNSTTTASCIPQPYSGQDGGNSSFLANDIVILPVTQPLDIALDSGVKGIKVAHFQLNGPWNSCDVLKEVTVHHLGDGAVSDIDNIYITDGSMNVLTPVQSFLGKQSTVLVLKTPYIILQDSFNNDFYVVINTAIGSTTGTHQIAIYPDNNGISDFVFSPVGHIIAGAENIFSTSFTITP